MKKNVRDKLYARLSSLNKAELNNLLQYFDRERNLLNSIINVLQEAVLLVDQKGTINFYNDAASSLLGLPKNHKQLAPLWHWMPSLKPFFTATEDNLYPDVFSKETDLIYPENKWVRVHIQHFQECYNHCCFIALIQDITQETQENEERLIQERFDSVVQLASEVAHELGNPLNSMGIHLQLIQRALSSIDLPENVKHSINICQNEIHRLDEIIEHFLQAVRPRELCLKKGDVVGILKDVVSVLKPQLENLNITIDIKVQGNLSPVLLDKARLHQAFFNVIKNAIEAIGTHGWIRISCYQNDCYLTVAFADSGCGISGTQAAKMFSNANQSTKSQGHGIGMLIIRRILREHHGYVEIESKANVGSILYLKIPLSEQSLKKLDTTHSKQP